jgi:two-component system, chemotaxis family, sensor kinase Cph1
MTRRAASVNGARAAPDERLLDAFASRAAHSLGAGVSIAGGYATLLRERFSEPLGAEGLSALAGLEGGLDRLRLFVDDLLELSALETTPLKRGPLRCTGAARAAAGGLAVALDEADVEVEIGPLPDIVADSALLERLFHHLIRGSLGAIGSGPGGVEISGVRRAAGARIEVSDDGPPLHRSSAGALFEPFAAPRGTGPATGAGVSMAIARRIAERHGGSAWAHTGRREGCTIVVLLPEAV